MRWVYTSGTEKPPPPIVKTTRPAGHGGFFSSLFTTFGGNTPQRITTPLPPPVEQIDPLVIHQTSVSLSIYSADVDIRLDKKMSAELMRSTKKSPPSALKYELIYVRLMQYCPRSYYDSLSDCEG